MIPCENISRVSVADFTLRKLYSAETEFKINHEIYLSCSNITMRLHRMIWKDSFITYMTITCTVIVTVKHVMRRTMWTTWRINIRLLDPHICKLESNVNCLMWQNICVSTCNCHEYCATREDLWKNKSTERGARKLTLSTARNLCFVIQAFMLWAEGLTCWIFLSVLTEPSTSAKPGPPPAVVTATVPASGTAVFCLRT